MIVSKRIINKWKLKLKHGDFQRMEGLSGKNARVLSRALRLGKMEQETFDILQSYFDKK